MRDIYYETISNIINDNLYFEQILFGIYTDDINFGIVTLSVFEKIIIYPYKDSMKIIGKQKVGLFNETEKKELKMMWSKAMLQDLLNNQEIKTEDKWFVNQIFKKLNNPEDICSTSIILKEDINRIELELEKIFTKSMIQTLKINTEIIMIDFDILILEEKTLFDFSNLLKKEKLINELSILPIYNWEDEEDDRTIGIKMLIKLKGE